MSDVDLPRGEPALAPLEPVSPLIYKHELLDLTGTSYVSIWKWMRAGTFPRGLIIGGRTAWHRAEIDAWLASRPRQVLKGDPKPGPVKTKKAVRS